MNFSLKTKIDNTETKIIPNPLKRGNMITDGTVADILVITKLITQSEIAEPREHGKEVFKISSFWGFLLLKNKRIKKATINEL